MRLHRFTCPKCAAVLNSKAGVAEGQRVNCPKCKAPFQAVAPVVEEPEEEPVEEESEEEPRPGKKKSTEKATAGKAKGKKKAPSAGNAPLLLGGIAGGVVLLLAVAGGLWAFGVFGGKQTPSTQVTSPPTTQEAPGGLVELSEPEATLANEEIQGHSLLVVHWKVKYRFTEGKPDPAGWYLCQASYSTGGMSIVDRSGQALQPEGVFEERGLILKNQQTPKSLTFSVHFGRSKGGYNWKCSKEVSCAVTTGEAPKTTPEQEAVIARITALGGKVLRQGNQPEGVAVHVDLHGKPVTDADLAEIKKLAGLQFLDVSVSRITDAGLAHLKDLNSLTVLRVHDNPGVTDAGIIHLKGLTNLTQFAFVRTGATDAVLEHLKGMTKMEQLYIGGKGVGDKGLVHLQDFPKLRDLALGQSAITDAGLAHVARVSKLEILLLTDTQVTDAGLAHLKSLPALTTLVVVRTQVTEAGIMDLKKALPKLTNVVQRE